MGDSLSCVCTQVQAFMAVDYDLVILGSTPEGYAAAAQAVQLGARVAWVLPDGTGWRSPLQILSTLWALQHPEVAPPPPETPLTPWQWARQRATLITDILTQDGLQRLLVQGVDVIVEPGRVTGDRPLQITTTSRRLTTRGLLLATGSRASRPPLPGLDSVPTETPETFLGRETFPQSVAILGSAPTGLALAQLLCYWGVMVTLISPNVHLLSYEDPEVSMWLLAHLRAMGVQVHLGTPVTAITATAAAITLQLPATAVTAEVLVVATAARPYWHGLGLETWLARDRPLSTNAFLQTEHPRIYACGSVLGGGELPAIARQEARLAVHNGLFWRRHRIDYRTLPYDLPTHPAIARVGLTEPQARRRFASNVVVVRQALYDIPKAQWLGATSGFCKLIAHRNGQLLGVHGIGPDANEWVQTLALLMAQKAPWWVIADAPTLPHTLTEVLRQVAQPWQRDRWQPGRWRRDWAENWCNWRRSR